MTTLTPPAPHEHDADAAQPPDCSRRSAARHPYPLRAGAASWMRTLRLGTHVLRGVASTQWGWTRLPELQRDQRTQAWAQHMLGEVGIQVEVRGTPPADGTGACIVANHISWLDIPALLSVLPCRFVAKDEVARWPLVGTLARRAATLFVQRGHALALRQLHTALCDRLRAGAPVAIFPEGTTTDGSHVRPFFAALLQPAIDTATPVYPVALRYRRSDGLPSPNAWAYHGDMTLWQSIRRVCRQPAGVVEMQWLPPIEPAHVSRQALARRAHAAIVGALTRAQEAPVRCTY
ncbi:lysophospholipid acyltransferase family protein [Tepidimonas aquatica]|nr:lysophospholipid acyltransferase family protein [Tepidimonas aquatica]